MSLESYEATVRIRISTSHKTIESDTHRDEWVLEGADILADGIEQFVGEKYRSLGGEFEILSCTAIPTTVVGVD